MRIEVSNIVCNIAFIFVIFEINFLAVFLCMQAVLEACSMVVPYLHCTANSLGKEQNHSFWFDFDKANKAK